MTEQKFFTYDVWSEGYSATGQYSRATYHGEWTGRSFEDACARWAAQTENPECYDAEYNTYWACKLFDNEDMARRSYG